jgi:hypothetical protein
MDGKAAGAVPTAAHKCAPKAPNSFDSLGNTGYTLRVVEAERLSITRGGS